MTELKRGQHTTFTSKNGTVYWVCNANGKYYVQTQYGSVRKATKEIKDNIKLV